MPNPFEIRCLLRQQTPMIHFQHEHPDATLRATELKAKLDKFIFKKLEKQYKEKADRDAFWAAHPHWKVGNGKSEHDALDYKLRVTPALSWTQPIEIPKVRDNQIDLDRNGKPKLDNYPGFFGNLGDEHEQETEKKFRFATEPIPVTIFCLHDDLRDYIKTHLPEFFYSHTFGTRQSKGFGAFKLVSLDGLEKLPAHMSIFRFQVTVNDQDLGRFIDQYGIRFPGKKIDRETAKEWLQQKQLFEHIELFHKSIRSGYNHQNPGYYQKSILFKYFRDPAQNIQWDKKSIKLSLFKRELDAQVSDYPKSDVLLFSDHTPDRLSTNGRRFLVRDLLGLASESDWGKEFGNQKVEKTNEVIQRFKSPITYKPHRLNEQTFLVHILVNPIEKQFFNKTFKIKVKGQNSPVLDLDTPERFSLVDYFKYFTTDSFQVRDLMEEPNKPQLQKIIQMHESLKSNYKSSVTKP